MSESTVPTVKAPWHIWVVGVVSLLWNSGGALDFVMTESRNKAYTSSFTAEQSAYFYGFPVWVVAVWGVAVWGGVLGSLLVLLRKRQAVPLFLASAVCMVLIDIYSFALSNGFKVMGGGGLAFSAVIFVIGVLLLAYARAMRKRRVLG